MVETKCSEKVKIQYGCNIPRVMFCTSRGKKKMEVRYIIHRVSGNMEARYFVHRGGRIHTPSLTIFSTLRKTNFSNFKNSVV